MKRIILLLVLMISLTGCEAVYNLDIDGDSFKEELVLTTDKQTNDVKKTINVALKANIPLNDEYYKPEVNFKQNDLKYYEISKIDTNNILGVRYNGAFSKDEYSSSTILKEHNPDFKLSEKGNVVSLMLGKRRNIFDDYPELDKLTINISLNNQVTGHNADGVSGTTYTWYLTRENYKTKGLYLNYNKVQQVKHEEEQKFDYSIIYYILGFSLLIFIIYILIKAKNTGQ